MLAVRHPDLACVIDLAGPTDLPALKANPAAYRLATDAFGTAALAQFSPALHAGSIKARLMLVFAQDDPLVPVAQGHVMARADPNAQLIVLPPGPAAFIHTGVGAPVEATGVDLAASQRAQQAEVAFIAAAAGG
jgi:pimeloyl-ACP methyl ester carboxylesterase